MTLMLNNEEVEGILSMSLCIEALEPLYKEHGEGSAVAFARADLHVPTPFADQADDPLIGPDTPLAHYLKTMGGATPHYGVAALRLSSDICAWPMIDGLRRRVKLPAAPGRKWLGLILLFSSATGELLAILNDGFLSRMRVGATNGLGAKYLARPDARVVGLFGSGWQAGAQLLALKVVRPIEEVRVFSPTREHRERFAAEMTEQLRIPVRAVDAPERVIAGADILVTATNTREPFFEARWLSPGVHLSCLQRDEITEETYHRADVLAIHTRAVENNATSTALNARYGHLGLEIRDHPRKLAIDWASLPTLGELAAGKAQGRTSAAQITAFINNIGLGAQFAAVGKRVYEEAKRRGIGRELPTEWFLQDIHP